MFERFTERARQVVVLAQDEARAFSHNYIGTEHLLLGILRVEDGIGARALQAVDVSLEEVRAQVARIVGRGEDVMTGQIPFTPRAKKVLELSLREALQLGHSYIGTEHILLGLVREGEGVAMRILLDHDADAAKVRDAVIRLLAYTPAPAEDLVEHLAPELREEVERVRAEREKAIEAQELERAASLRVRERNLIRLASAGNVEGFDEEASRPLPEVRTPPVHVPPRRTPVPRGTTMLGSGSSAPGQPLALYLAGGATFGVALGLGILLGRLIWG